MSKRAFLQVHFEIPQPILLCTYTNVAVDNLVEGLVAAGLKPLRVGFGGKVKDSLLEHTLDHKLKTHPLAAKLEEAGARADEVAKRRQYLLTRISDLRATKPTGNKAARLANMETGALSLERQYYALKGKAYGLYMHILREVIHGSDVVHTFFFDHVALLKTATQVCTTCITSASIQLNVSDFPIVFIDEASMSTEPATLIPLMKGVRVLIWFLVAFTDASKFSPNMSRSLVTTSNSRRSSPARKRKRRDLVSVFLKGLPTKEVSTSVGLFH